VRHKLFNNQQGARVYPIREFLGSYLPSGRDGFVIEDLDWAAVVPEDAQLLIVRKHGARYRLDGTGTFLAAEFKYRSDLMTHLDHAQKRTFELLDEQWRLGDEWRASQGQPRRYGGFFVVAYNESPPNAETTLWCMRRVGPQGERWERMSWEVFSNWLQVVDLGVAT
jgi:hypothetical protein